MTRSGRTFSPLLVLLAIILLAAALRFWHLNILPPGLMGDEATNGSDERMVLSGAALPIYFAATNGREPLFLYLQALSMALLGPSLLALRLVSALMGILTVPAVYFCALVLLRRPDEGARHDSGASRETTWLALLAAATIAVSYWSLHLSRLGLRAVSLPPISAMAIAFFWRAWSGGRRRDYAWSGLWLGLAFYTYNAARVLPLVVASFLLLEAALTIWQAWRQPVSRPALKITWCSRWRGLLLLACVCALLIIPLAVAAVNDPAVLGTRAEQVSIFSFNSEGQVGAGLLTTGAGRLIQNLVLVGRSFYDRGDSNAGYNLSGRPVNDFFLAILFTLGLLTSCWQIREGRYRFVLLWLVLMLLPTILTVSAPHNLRAVGALPPLAVLCASGGGTILAALRPKSRLRLYVAPGLVVGTLLISGSLTARDYFGRWGTLTAQSNIFQVDRQLAAETVAGLLQRAPGEPVLIPQRLYAQPNMVFMVGPAAQATLPEAWSADPPPVHFVLDGPVEPQDPLVVLWRDAQGLKTANVASLAPSDATTLSQLLGKPDAVEVHRSPLHHDGWPVMYEGVLPAGIRLQPWVVPNPLAVRFANGFQLLGYDVQPDSLQPNGQPRTFRVTLLWQVDRGVDAPRIIIPEAFVQLANHQGVWKTNGHLPPESYLLPWLRGPRTMVDSRVLAAPQDMPNGKAFFEVGFLAAASESGGPGTPRVDILDDQGRPVGDQINLGAVMIGEPPPQASLAGLRPLNARFADRIELTGWRVTAVPGKPNALTVDLGWLAQARALTDYTAFAHLVDASGRIIAQHDQPPGGSENPTTLWVPGESVRSAFTLEGPPGTDMGGMKLRIGLYEPVSGRQARVQVDGPTSVEVHDTFLLLPLDNLHPASQ